MCPEGYYCAFGICRCEVSNEVCDGVDNDCDQDVDELGDGGLIDVGDPCANPVGVCAGGQTVCSDGVLDCSVQPEAEVCNDIDDDCNGTADDGLDPAVCPCAPGGPGPGPEICNDIDDDCNGMVDDGLDPAVCPCAPGGPGPGPEICNDVDDDCDTEVDEETMLCGDDSACACAPGGPGPSTPEVCNGIDDDCNDAVDDGLTDCACKACGVAGGELCNNLDDDCNGMVDDGVPDCACAPGGPGPGPEVCNEVDDDCNTMIDEINTLNGMPCGAFGDPCTMDSDCSSQLCVGDVFDMYCSDECLMVGDPGDCPVGYRCWDDPVVGADDSCRRNYAPCVSNADCGPGEVCAITCDDTGNTAITECRPAIPGGAAAPSACSSDPDCAAYDCFRTGICIEVCASDTDCPSGHRCVMVSTGACGGGDYVPRCLDACDCDSECPMGELCQPWAHQVLPPATATAVGACDVNYGGGAPGDNCDLTAMPALSCEHAICSNGGTGFCTQVCSATCGCPAPIGPCINSTITFPVLGSYSGMTCQTM